MDPALTALLQELHDHGVAHDAARGDRTERLRNLEPASAQLLSVLVRATGARTVLELGTSNGYSTIWLADAVRETGGRLTSVDLDAGRSAEAAHNLARAGLADRVDLRVQDGDDALRGSADAGWDMILLDAERPAYPSYWGDLQRSLRPGGLLAVDNVISHAEEVASFRELVTSTPGVHEALAPCGAGVLLVVMAGRSRPAHPTGLSGS